MYNRFRLGESPRSAAPVRAVLGGKSGAQGPYPGRGPVAQPALFPAPTFEQERGQVHEHAGEFPIFGGMETQDRERVLETGEAADGFVGLCFSLVDFEGDPVPVRIGQHIENPLFEEDGSVLLPEGWEQPLEGIAGHASKSVSEKAQLTKPRLPSQRRLLVTGVGKPIVQEICYSFGLHRVYTLTDLCRCARIGWRFTGWRRSRWSAADPAAAKEPMSDEDRFPLDRPPRFRMRSGLGEVTTPSRRALRKSPRRPTPGPPPSGKDPKPTLKGENFI